ncbi:homogentisate 1,2-dioxygenase [Epidermidibacterium keratini]|uniref:Homogentisate 1,2-dioxygenase n=1 Tax=Epidermidibacterium keratini TaxID=1891644 RepID=A0A7L4YQZ2_9ACTN|nr:homogentisate 1,2-dioxygenase [Epidermidibacterium keratini]QHC00977.1 homogentisate 1,2-dioxygenase [Epidermidibacterium keratini]
MAYYRAVGNIPPKRHTQHRNDDGKLYYEELMGEEGFSADSSLLYHKYIPSTITDSRPWDLGSHKLVPNHPLKPLHLKLHSLFSDEEADNLDPVRGRRMVLGNGDVRIYYSVSSVTSPLYRNAVGDELVYIEEGWGTVETVFGVLDYRQGDYIVIPRATNHRYVPGERTRFYIVEANSHISPARNYLSKYGQLLEHSPFCERDLTGPGDVLLHEEENVDIYVKHRTSEGIVGTIFTTPQHPFDVVGWDGCLYPYTFNISDYEPITGRVHQPPPTHQVFEGNNFVVCNFVPRKVDYHPLSIPVPYYHSNVDSDEVMFYCGGNYEARKGSGIGNGSISLHPGGHAHGPQPGAYEKSIGVEYFDELAVMVDTFRPLELGEGGLASDDESYAWSWATNA